jgi:NADH dehydrogenase
MSKRAKVVIVGGGFGGLWAAKDLSNEDVDVALIDRKNHHVFQPLLYQVATAVLSPGEIAQPIRRILHSAKNTEVILGEVVGFDREKRVGIMEDGTQVPFDYLVVAAGARHADFGQEDWEAGGTG